MARTARKILAILAGMAVWGALWNVGNQAAQSAFPDLLRPDQPIEHTGMLALFIGYSVILSALAGFVTAWAAGPRPMPVVWALAIVQLGIGIFAEISYWGLMPVWYHLVFLALVVPATVVGGKLRADRGRQAMATT